MRPDDLFHTGIVVDDLDDTLARLTAAVGYRWCEKICLPSQITTADGQEIEMESTFCYSMGGPRLEIIQATPGTIWEPATSGIHHLGYWSDDVAADSARLVEHGMVRELHGGPEDAPMFAYHRGQVGPRIEILARWMSPMFEQYWTDGKNPFS
ncbi:MAG: VOC family protein [Acidimicrobiales bacterium]|nr:VOC family protein [Acidimicrobiales bacterium]